MTTKTHKINVGDIMPPIKNKMQLVFAAAIAVVEQDKAKTFLLLSAMHFLAKNNITDKIIDDILAGKLSAHPVRIKGEKPFIASKPDFFCVARYVRHTCDKPGDATVLECAISLVSLLRDDEAKRKEMLSFVGVHAKL